MKAIETRTLGLNAWPGLDSDFSARVADVGVSPGGRRFRRLLEHELVRSRGQSAAMGPPLLMQGEWADALGRFAEAYHRCMERVVGAYVSDARLRRTMPVPATLEAAFARDPSEDIAVHLCRLDLLPSRDGGFVVLETNANCPGGLLTCGIAARRWRGLLDADGVTLPSALPNEEDGWMASWFLETVEEALGDAPGLVVLVREQSGNRLELPGLAALLRCRGVAVIEADPREFSVEGGSVRMGGARVASGYWKLGFRELLRMGSSVEPVVRAVGTGTLFVPNGLRGRAIADNKLALAVLSDPSFDDLFDPEDIERIRPHLPWSRNLALCSKDVVDSVRGQRERFVLKRPYDTRGRGVAMGIETTAPGVWARCVTTAVREGWLVQAYHVPTETAADFRGGRQSHDVCIGVANGVVVSAHGRSSPEPRLNVANGGRLHPVFMEAPR